MKNALEQVEKELKGVALRLCQWKDEDLCYEGKIWIAEDESLITTLLLQCHHNSLAGDGGTAKSKELVSREYYWPKLRDTIN